MSLGRLPYREPESELAAAVDRFLAVRDLMPTSRRSYRQVLTAVTAAAGPTRPVGDLAAPDLAAALTESYGTAAAATWNRAATIVRGFAGWCAEQGWTEDQLPRLAKLTRRRRPRPPADRVLPVEVIDGLCRRPDVPLREKTLWRLAYETAGRAEELLGLNVEDLDLANKRARITGKGGAVEVLHFQSGQRPAAAPADRPAPPRPAVPHQPRPASRPGAGRRRCLPPHRPGPAVLPPRRRAVHRPHRRGHPAPAAALRT